jgi:hypothetical protein
MRLGMAYAVRLAAVAILCVAAQGDIVKGKQTGSFVGANDARNVRWIELNIMHSLSMVNSTDIQLHTATTGRRSTAESKAFAAATCSPRYLCCQVWCFWRSRCFGYVHLRPRHPWRCPSLACQHPCVTLIIRSHTLLLLGLHHFQNTELWSVITPITSPIAGGETISVFGSGFASSQTYSESSPPWYTVHALFCHTRRTKVRKLEW